MRGGDLGGGDEQRGGAVVVRAGVAGGDGPVDGAETLGPSWVGEGCAQPGERLGRRVRPDRLVGLQLTDGPVGAGGLERGDLAGESPVGPGRGGPLVAGQGELVELAAREPPPSGDEFGTHTLRDQPRCVAGGDRRPGHVLGNSVDAGLAADRDAGHRLHPGRDRDVVRTGDDTLCGERQGLLARPALPVHGGARHRFGEPRGERGEPGRVAALLADLSDGSTDDVVDLRRIELCAIDQRP